MLGSKGLMHGRPMAQAKRKPRHVSELFGDGSCANGGFDFFRQLDLCRCFRVDVYHSRNGDDSPFAVKRLRAEPSFGDKAECVDYCAGYVIETAPFFGDHFPRGYIACERLFGPTLGSPLCAVFV